MNIPKLPMEIINNILYKYKGFAPYEFHKEFNYYVNELNRDIEEMEEEYIENEENNYATNLLEYVNMKVYEIPKVINLEEEKRKLLEILPDFF